MAQLHPRPADRGPADSGPATRARGAPLEASTIILAIAMWMALGYVLDVGWKCCVTGTFAAASRNVLWMAPLSAGALALLLLAPLPLLAPFLPRPLARRFAVAAATWLVAFAALLPWTQVHRLAAAVLAAGVASVAARSWASPRAIRRIHQAGVAIAATLLLTGGALTAWRAWQVHRGYAALGTPRDGAPNVLILLLDTVRATALSLYGYERHTSPVLDSLAAGGVTFEHAVSTAPWTLPAHGSLFTGMYDGVMSTTFTTPLDARHPTVAEQFRDAGYETIGFTANLHYTAWDSGLSRGFLRWLDFKDDVRQVLRSGWLGQMSSMRQLIHARSRWQLFQAVRHPELEVVPKPGGVERNAAELVDAMLAWHATRRDRSRPWFAFANFFDAHRDYAPPPPWNTRFAADSLRPSDRARYDGEIAFVDHEIGRLLRTLRARGDLERTLIVVVSDHGEQFGEHRVSGHGNSLFYQVLQVPLVLRWDGVVPAGRRVDAIVSIRDLPATLASLAGIPLPPGFPGVSLAPLWSDDRPLDFASSAAISELTQDPIPRTADPLSRSQGVSLVSTNGEHGIHRATPGARAWMYDVRADRSETRNLTLQPDGAARHRAQRRTLQALLREDDRRHGRR